MKAREHLVVCWSNAMFSGKSEEAGTRAVLTEQVYGRKWLLVRPKASKRRSDSSQRMKTHGGREFPCKYFETAKAATEKLRDFMSDGISFVWFDEIQLWSDWEAAVELVRSCLNCVPVIVSMLSMTSEGKPFPGSGAILAMADEIIFCDRAICMVPGCGRKATRSWYRAGVKTEDIKVGGAESYIPVCTRCWNELAEKNP